MDDEEDVRAAALQSRVFEEQTRALYAKGGTALVANLVNSLILVLALWNAVSHRLALAWLLAMYVTVAFRFLLLHRHNSAQERPYRALRWARLWTGTTALTGAIWGTGGALLYPQEWPGGQDLVLFVIGGMVGGASSSLSSFLPAYVAFTIPALAPPVVRLLAEQDRSHGAMALLLCIFGRRHDRGRQDRHAHARRVHPSACEERGARDRPLRHLRAPLAPEQGAGGAGGRAHRRAREGDAGARRFRLHRLARASLAPERHHVERGSAAQAARAAGGRPTAAAPRRRHHLAAARADIPHRRRPLRRDSLVDRADGVRQVARRPGRHRGRDARGGGAAARAQGDDLRGPGRAGSARELGPLPDAAGPGEPRVERAEVRRRAVLPLGAKDRRKGADRRPRQRTRDTGRAPPAHLRRLPPRCLGRRAGARPRALHRRADRQRARRVDPRREHAGAGRVDHRRAAAGGRTCA